jgi:hypothetical protein
VSGMMMLKRETEPTTRTPPPRPSPMREAARRPEYGFQVRISNRKLLELETGLSYRKQTTAILSDRNFFRGRAWRTKKGLPVFPAHVGTQTAWKGACTNAIAEATNAANQRRSA